jgi:hypothetical protein
MSEYRRRTHDGQTFVHADSGEGPTVPSCAGSTTRTGAAARMEDALLALAR